MPIGFWAKGRSDVREYLAFQFNNYHHKNPPTHEQINKTIKILNERLDQTFEETIIDIARGELKV